MSIRSQFEPREFTNVDPVTMVCPKCQRIFKECHPTKPCFCPCDPRFPHRLVTPEQFTAAYSYTVTWMMKRGLLFSGGKGPEETTVKLETPEQNDNNTKNDTPRT